MSYNVTTALLTENTNELSFMDIGIHDNVKLVNVKFEVSTSGNKFLAFEFEDMNGHKLTHTEWEPRDNDPKRITNQMKRVKHIVTKFIDETQYVFNAKDFEEFAQKTIQLIQGKYTNKLVRVKVVYNNQNYTDLPNYLPFIESMDIPKEKSKLGISSIDKMTREDNKPDPIRQVNNPLEEIPVMEDKLELSDAPF